MSSVRQVNYWPACCQFYHYFVSGVLVAVYTKQHANSANLPSVVGVTPNVLPCALVALISQCSNWKHIWNDSCNRL